MGREIAPGIEAPLIVRPAAPETPQVEPPEPAVRPVVQSPTRPEPSKDRVGVGSPGIPNSGRRPASDKTRPRTLVTSITINLAAGRVALSTSDGPPYRGDVDTDLEPGAYYLSVDRRQSRWVFEQRQVRSGLRFDLTIDGPDPFTLAYAEPLVLLVTGGLDNVKADTLAQAVAYIERAVYDNDPERWADAVDYLCRLNQVDLYDVLDELETARSGVISNLLLHFALAAARTDLEGQDGVLRALESFVRKPAEYYVDGFDSWQVSPDTWKRDEARERAGLSLVQLVLSFGTPPSGGMRALTVYADDISDSPEKDAAPPTYGPLALTYPTRLSLGTTPKLYEAKKAALAHIEAQNSEFIIASFKLSAEVLLGVYQASLSFAKLAAQPRPSYTPRAERGPGSWRPTFEGGSNMSAEAEAYELSSCGTPRGMGYYVDGVQFEGFKGGSLLDGKFWMTGGRMDGLMRNAPGLARSIVRRQALRQLNVAAQHGVRVQWRVANAQIADLLRNFMQSERLAIDIVFIAP